MTDVAEISGNRQTFVPGLRYSSVTDAIFVCQGEVGDWSEATSVIGADGRLGSIKEFKPHTKMIFAAEKVALPFFLTKSRLH